ncbi:hypothetical protein MITS9508_00976 [Synechococcus sp. MIT S9508]|nr:hypothetical protein MITS9508_00976 [Synechococcus sp. MIT S9508]
MATEHPYWNGKDSVLALACDVLVSVWLLEHLLRFPSLAPVRGPEDSYFRARSVLRDTLINLNN